MKSKKDEIMHLKHLHIEYKNKYNSKRQTIEEESKTNSMNASNNELNININNKNKTINNLGISENNIKSNKNQITNINNSLSENIHGKKEGNLNLNIKKIFPSNPIHFPIDKKKINEDDGGIGIDSEQDIQEIKGENNNIDNDKIKINLKIDKNIERRQSEFLFDSKIKNKLLYEFKMNLDEKIYELKKKLNLSNLNTETEKFSVDENIYENIFTGNKNLNPNIINSDKKSFKNNNNNILENSKNFKKQTINMMESFDINSFNMDQASIRHQIPINNSISLKDSICFKKIKISLDKFISINQISLKKSPYLIMLSFLNSKDIFQIFQTNKKIRELFLQSLKLELNTYIGSKFKKITKNLFDNYSFYICLDKSIRYKKLKISLILKSKIISKNLLQKSMNFQYFAHFPCDDNQFVQNSFILDVKEPPLYYWVMKESTNFNQDELNKAYFMNVMQYTLGDYVEFTVNIFTEKGLMDIRKLIWNKITVFKTPKENFLDYSNENILKREIVDFDVSRYCEMELCKGKWNDIILLEEPELYIGELKKKFSKNFNILKILFDNVGYYIFKFYLEGKHPGAIDDDEEIGIKITVLNLNEEKSNETKKNNLVFDRKNEIQMHIGDILIFYISKNTEFVAH